MRAEGFAPVFDGESELLILGSFPSVKSRAIEFYYGNPQNRFWRMLCGYFKSEVPVTTEDKRNFVLSHKIALWDIVTECEIVGSADVSIRDERIAEIADVVEQSRIRMILCNGAKSYELLALHFPQYLPITRKMSSTSPANPRFSAEAWYRVFDEVFDERI